MLDLRRHNAPVFFTEDEESAEKLDIGVTITLPT